jgi:uncharacterized protein (TIGR00269 family)
MAPKCRKCGAGAEIYLDYARSNLCPDCFKEFFEKKVKSTILKYDMVKRDDKVIVAASGGKDSSTLLFVLRELFPKIELKAVHINLGIEGYSDECEQKFRELVDYVGVDFVVFDLKKELGISIDDFKNTIYRRRLCSPCGTIKRYLMNKLAYEEKFTKLATGHNLDDVVEVMFNNYLHGEIDQLVKLKPVLLSTHPKLVAKVKPLWEMTEMENMFYASYYDIPFRAVECPLSKGARSLERKRLLNSMASKIHGFKHTFVKSHVNRILPLLEKSVDFPPLIECGSCGMPSSDNVCAFCKRIQLARSLKNSQPNL